MKKTAFLFVALIVMASCAKPTKEDVELNELFAMMQGSFNSERQATQDSSYYNISLHMYPIWEDRGKFLYVEQALYSRPDRPYRQRIFQLERKNENTLASYSYVLPNDTMWVGKWKTPKVFNTITLKGLTEREGCGLFLVKQADDSYKGATDDKSCSSTMLGASYATSQVSISKQKIISWDRGYDSSGNQVWGAEKGGYVFDKIDERNDLKK